MFSHQQISHFRAFGFVVLPALLDEGETAQLSAEVTSALTDAYGDVGTDDDLDGTGGIRGDYLPLSVDRAPLSQALIADDPRLFQGSVALLGAPTVPRAPIATCFTSNAGWHSDDGTGAGGLKFLAHLEPRRAATGGLLVIPGSHDSSFGAKVQGYSSQDPALQGFAPWPVPAIALETEPGDVIAFHRHLFHASSGGRKRLAWTIEYLPWPGIGDLARLEAVRHAVADQVDHGHPGYDAERWPTWREWAAGARHVPSRQTALDRLRLLGVVGEGAR